MKSVLTANAVRELLAWFAGNGVDYAWSRTEDPWAVWVSEVMLQQTTVNAVEPRYRRWMDRFPTPGALADADEEAVLREWEGLGYYSRARNLAAAAREIRDSLGGRIPGDAAGLKTLPGVGDYTAAAVASFCFGERTAAIDANGRRIAQRLAASPEWKAPLAARFRTDVESLMPENRPGDLNAAIMQLGQIVCTPSSPDCAACPLASSCRARTRGIQEEIPARKQLKIIRKTTNLALALEGGRVLMHRRTEGLGRGLWFFPPTDEAEGIEAWIPGEELPSRVHAYTRYRETLLPRIFLPPPGIRTELRIPSGEWVDLDGLDRKPMPSAYRKLAGDLASRACTSGPKA